MLTYNTLIVLAGAGLLGAGAGMIGCFAVLRRRALTGDALAHAALPGLCLAFLVVGERSLPALLFGAFLTGVLGVAAISALTRWTRVKEDAAIGIVLSVFFGAGIVLERLIQNLSTTGSRAGLDSYILGKTAGMIAQDVFLIGTVSLLCLLVVLLLYKEFRLIAFDSGFACVQGWPAQWLDLLLMALVALTVVVGLPAVGVVLMAALLILPGAAARFWTDRLGVMLLLSAGFGLVTGVTGSLLSAAVERLPAGPIVVLVGTTLFGVSALLAPRRGALARLVRHLAFQREIEERNLLRILFDLSEPALPGVPAVAFADLLARKAWPARRLTRLLASAEARGLVGRAAEGWALTDAGLRRAAEVARGYRLWELFLTEYPDQAGLANLAHESVEALLPPPLVEELTRKLGAGDRWPGGADVRIQGEAP